MGDVMTTTLRTRRLAVLLLAGALAACGDAGEDRPAADPAGEPAADAAGADTATAESAGLTVSGPWVRVAIRPEGSDAPDAPPVNSAAYLMLRNGGAADDALTAVETEIADTAELHTVSMDEGVMRMRPVDAIPVAAGEEAVLEPGGYHIMLIGIHQALEEGDSVDLTLRLRSGEAVTVRAPVRRSAPGR
jgi:copper(I)-binding protein